LSQKRGGGRTPNNIKVMGEKGKKKRNSKLSSPIFIEGGKKGEKKCEFPRGGHLEGRGEGGKSTSVYNNLTSS